MGKELDVLAKEAARLLLRKHSALHRDESINIDFSFYRGARRIQLILADNTSQTVMEFFADVPDMEGQDAIELGLDFLDGVLKEYLSSNRESIPRLDPAPYQFDGHTVYLSGGTRRPALEAAADALLKEAKKE